LAVLEPQAKVLTVATVPAATTETFSRAAAAVALTILAGGQTTKQAVVTAETGSSGRADLVTTTPAVAAAREAQQTRLRDVLVLAVLEEAAGRSATVCHPWREQQTRAVAVAVEAAQRQQADPALS
jgi:hypothetical protein